jgi:hypothetical protein
MEMLNELEVQVLRKLLEGDHESLVALRRQLEGCRVRKREYSGTGFFAELDAPEDAQRAPVTSARVRFGDVVADVEGVEHGVGFVLFIDDGTMTMLEGYTFDEPWPEQARLIGTRYSSEPRDLSKLE